MQELIKRVNFVVNIGLDYIQVNRRMDTLSGGEAQRVRLASQLGSGLTGVLYVLDEPSIDCTAVIQRGWFPYYAPCVMRVTPWLWWNTTTNH